MGVNRIMETKEAIVIGDILDRFTYHISQKTDEDGCIHYGKIIKIKNKLIEDILKKEKKE